MQFVVKNLKENQQAADQALRMHTNRIHNRIVQAPNDLHAKRENIQRKKI